MYHIYSDIVASAYKTHPDLAPKKPPLAKPVYNSQDLLLKLKLGKNYMISLSDLIIIN